MRCVLILMAMGGISQAEPTYDNLSVNTRHEADGKKYPNPIDESYQIDVHDPRALLYKANFDGLTAEVPHRDSAEWKSQHCAELYQLAVKLAKSGELSHESPARGAFILIEGRDAKGNWTKLIAAPKTRAWEQLNAKFMTMVKIFEKETGRPKKPSQLHH